MSEKDRTEIVVSVLGLEKLFAPTMEYAGEQLKDLVKFFVERARSRLRKDESDDSFHGLYAKRVPLIASDFIELRNFPVEAAKSANPYDTFPNWDWPLHGNRSDQHLDNILCPVGHVVDRENFLNLLCKSLSLNLAEKRRVIEAWPELSQFQIDELTKIFIEEREKFENNILGEHPGDVWRLVHKTQLDWAILVLGDERIGMESCLIPPLNGDFLFPYFALWSKFWLANGCILMDKVKDYRSASRALAQACSLEPDNGYSWLRLGYCYVRLRYFDFSLECFNRVRALNPDHHLLLLDMCEIHILQSNHKKARECLNELVEKIDDSYLHVYWTLDLILSMLETKSWVEPSDYLNEYVRNIENETNWYWVDLKEYINGVSIEDADKRRLTKLLQVLVSLSV